MYLLRLHMRSEANTYFTWSLKIVEIFFTDMVDIITTWA
jgi:hypothetical protein